MDLVIGHKLAKDHPEREYLQTGDAVDSWKVIAVEPEKQLTLLFGMKAPGLGRLCSTLEDKGGYRTIDVRVFWHPHGMPGLLYWLLMIPAHLFILRGMAKRITRLAEQSTDQSTRPASFSYIFHCTMGEITEEYARYFLNNSGLT